MCLNDAQFIYQPVMSVIPMFMSVYLFKSLSGRNDSVRANNRVEREPMGIRYSECMNVGLLFYHVKITKMSTEMDMENFIR